MQYNSLKKYNYYKKYYPKYLLLLKYKNKLITYNIDSKIISYLFNIDYVNEIFLDKSLFDELLSLKELYHFNIVVISNKIREYYCKNNNNYISLKNNSKSYVRSICDGKE